MNKLVSFAACVALMAAQAAPVFACAEVWEWAENAPVPVEREDVLIGWDPEAGLEHFVRRIAFGAAPDDFGFLVPLPSPPEIAEADAGVFARLDKEIEPVKLYAPGSFWLTGAVLDFLGIYITGATLGISGDEGGVRVLGVAKVAGSVATTLQADDAAALTLWLKANGYKTRPGLTAWLERYVHAKWTIVAFKYDPAQKDAPLDTKAVRLSFKTPEPFFPYREPADQRETASGPRLLKIFFVGPRRVTGRVGSAPWPGVEIHANQPRRLPRALDAALPASFSPARAWLTVFEDSSSPRPGTDELFFENAASSFPNVRAEVVWVPVFPLELVFLGLVVAAPVIIWRRRKRERLAREGQKG